MKMSKKIVIPCLIVIILAIIIFAISSSLSDSDKSATDTSSSADLTDTSEENDNTTSDNNIKFGELLSVIENENIVVVKAKITSSFSNEDTIVQNYYNVADLIKNKGFEKYSELQYWAVADMSDGSEQKVISFTLNSDTIQNICNGQIVDNEIGSFADELWIHPSLRN